MRHAFTCRTYDLTEVPRSSSRSLDLREFSGMGGIALSLPTCFIGVRAMDRALGAPLEKAWSALPVMSLGVLDRIAGASIGSIRLGTSFCASSLRAPAYGAIAGTRGAPTDRCLRLDATSFVPHDQLEQLGSR